MHLCEQARSNKPIDKDAIRLNQEGNEAYLSKDRPIPEFTPAEYTPALPQDLATIRSSVQQQMTDAWVKAIVSGDSYTADQAMKDVMDIWNKAGGTKIDDWYKQWYADNKNSAFLTKDLYDFVL